MKPDGQGSLTRVNTIAIMRIILHVKMQADRPPVRRNKVEKKNGKVFRIIIVGCGKVGHSLVEQLSYEGHDITVVDTSEQVISDITDSFDVMGIQGSGLSLNLLIEAGLPQADVLIAVTGSDEVNLLCCVLARKTGDHLAAIARVRSPEFSEELPYLRQQLGLSMIINPDLEASRQIARIISRPQAITVSAFAKGHAELVRFRIPDGNRLCGKSIMDLGELFSFGFLVCAVERNGAVSIPRGTFLLQAGDQITILAKTKDVHRIFENIGMKTGAVHSCLVVGGGKTSYYLAQQLLEQHIDVRIIEANPQRCEELSLLLPGAVVVCGNGSDEQLLREERIETAEAFVALTGIDEENILMSLYARKIPGLKTITKINRITFNDVIDDLNLGSVVYPKYICAEEITAYVRARSNSIGSNVETLYHLFENRVEALEFRICKGSPVTGKPIMSLKLKDNLLIACISRRGKIIFPRGQDTIEEDDNVIIVTTHTGLNDISMVLR